MALTFHELTVADTVDETADSRSFVLTVPPELRERFAYRAGQFLTFEIPWTGFAIRRCYSLSSSPDVDAALRVTIKRVAGGRASNWMLDQVAAGQVLRVSPPDGRFVLDPAAGARPLALYGGGSGITPLLSILKSALATTTRSVQLVYANREPAAIILKRELDELARAHPGRLSLHYHCDCDGGFLDAEALAAFVRARADGDHYVCGPAPFMDLVSRALEAAAIAPERRLFERFISALDPDRRAALARRPAAAPPAAAPAAAAPAAAAPPATTPSTAADRPAADMAAANPPPAAGTTQPAAPAHPRSFVLRLGATAHTIAYEPGLTLLAAAQRCGVDAPSSCEDGYCGSCAARLVSGDVDMRPSQALDPSERARGAILLCQSLPASAAPLVIECAPISAREQPTLPTRPPQPLLPRVLASLFVLLVFTLFFLFRSHP